MANSRKASIPPRERWKQQRNIVIETIARLIQTYSPDRDRPHPAIHPAEIWFAAFTGDVRSSPNRSGPAPMLSLMRNSVAEFQDRMHNLPQSIFLPGMVAFTSLYLSAAEDGCTGHKDSGPWDAGFIELVNHIEKRLLYASVRLALHDALPWWWNDGDGEHFLCIALASEELLLTVTDAETGIPVLRVRASGGEIGVEPLCPYPFLIHHEKPSPGNINGRMSILAPRSFIFSHDNLPNAYNSLKMR